MSGLRAPSELDLSRLQPGRRLEAMAAGLEVLRGSEGFGREVDIYAGRHIF